MIDLYLFRLVILWITHLYNIIFLILIIQICMYNSAKYVSWSNKTEKSSHTLLRGTMKYSSRITKTQGNVLNEKPKPMTVHTIIWSI